MSSKSKRDENDPNLYYGTRTVITREHPCGFCRDKDCHLCHHEIAWFDNLWLCPCSCNKDWKPKAVVVERPKKTQ